MDYTLFRFEKKILFSNFFMLLLLFCLLPHKVYWGFLIFRIYFQFTASSGKLELECNPQLLTTTTTTTKYPATVTTRNPGLSHPHNSDKNSRSTNGYNRKTPAMPGKTSTGDHIRNMYVYLPKIDHSYNFSLCIYMYI